jgi:8-oxo-dGTP pyrophosphatase MutT (NUDIX family)
MIRNSLLLLLNAYNTAEPEEVEMLIEIKNFVAENEQCFERTFAPGHVTASGWIVSETGDKVLLMHHRKLDRWFQPGGHCDGDPDLLAVARKEVEEETGLIDFTLAKEGIFDVDIHLIPANSKEEAHYHYDVRFLFKADADTALTINSESRDLRWLPLAQVHEFNNSESIMRMVRKTTSL